MKKLACVLLVALLVATSAFANGSVESATDSKKTEVVVFAAASLTETLTEIKGVYEAQNPGVEIIYNFDSSGTLKTQIQEGAVCDIFISAGQKQVNQLDKDGLDLVLQGTRLDLLENKVTLAVPVGNPAAIKGFDDLAERLSSGNVFLCMGNSDVPVGQYTQLILAYYGLDEASLVSKGCITYGSNVKEVTTQVKEQSVDCGIIYATDAFSAKLEVVDGATAEMCGQVIYPACLIKTTAVESQAKAFLDYLSGDEAMAIFASVGFSKV